MIPDKAQRKTKQRRPPIERPVLCAINKTTEDTEKHGVFDTKIIFPL